MWDLELRQRVPRSQSLDWSWDLEALLYSVALYLPQHPVPSAFGLLWTHRFQPPRRSAPEPRLAVPEGRGRAAGTARPPSRTRSLGCWTDSVTKLWPPPASQPALPLWSKGVCCQNKRENLFEFNYKFLVFKFLLYIFYQKLIIFHFTIIFN